MRSAGGLLLKVKVLYVISISSIIVKLVKFNLNVHGLHLNWFN